MTSYDDNQYISELIEHIHNLQAHIDYIEQENAELYQKYRSYKMWMDRSIDRIKEMQK